MLLALLLFLPLIYCSTLPEDELKTYTTNGKDDLQIPLGVASSQFLLSLSPCGTIHWKLYKVTKDEEGKELIGGEEGEMRMNFYSAKLKGDDLLLIVSSSSSVTIDIMHSSSQLSIDEIYPPLPPDSRVFATFESSNTSKPTVDALVHWKVSRAIKWYPSGSRYRFCILSSLRPLSSSLSCPSSLHPTEDVQCGYTTNKMEIKDLKPGQQYYITVFIRDNRHATVSSYDTIQITVPGEKEDASIPLLTEGTLHDLEIPGSRGSSLSYEFQSKGVTAKRALLTVFSCSGYIRVSVWRGRKLLKKSEPFTAFRRFAILNGNGKLRIEIINDENHATPVKIWIGKGDGDSPYASLPEDTSVRVVRNGCDWADIQWFRSSDPNDEYCVYQRKESSNLLEQIVGKVENDCSNGIFPHSTLIGCYTHKGKASDDTIGILQTTVTGLPVDSTVRFDVLVRPSNRSISQALPYRTLWVRTLSSC